MQGGAEPHWHEPVAVQVSDLVASQLVQVEPALPQLETARTAQMAPAQQPLGHEVPSHTQAPLEQRWPTPHGALMPHRQVPLAPQLSALPSSQTAQVPPAVPHALSDLALQVVP